MLVCALTTLTVANDTNVAAITFLKFKGIWKVFIVDL
jgi:hypothetical protein